MKSPVLLFSTLLMVTNTILGQVVSVSSIDGQEWKEIQYVPDVEGKVRVALMEPGIPEKESVSDIPAVYPLWPLSRAGTNAEGGVFGNLDDDPEHELIFTVGNKVYAFNINGTNVTGWPKTLDFPADGAPAFGDIDGDGIGEIVVTTHQPNNFFTGTIYAFKINGDDVPGFPVATTGGALRTPVLADIDGDGALEIIVAIRNHPDGFIHIYRGDGSMFPNWPQPLDNVPGSAVAAGDITGDKIPEIIAESYYSLYAFTADGNILPGFPYNPGTNRVFSYSTPVLADIDEDGLCEIICGDHSLDQGNGAIHIVRNDGTAFPGWPKLTSYWVYGPPSVVDINGDNLLDIVVGDQALSVSPINKVYGWTAVTGDPLPGFPITGVWAVNSQVMLADLDGDGMIELMFDDNTSDGKYQGYNHDGTPMEGWPLQVNGTTFYVCPLIFDINLDGIMDIAGAGYDQGSGNSNIYLWNANVPMNSDLALLPMLQYNTRHNGVFGDYLMVGTPEPVWPEKLSLCVYPNPAGRQLAIGCSQFAVRGSQFAVRGSQFAVRGSQSMYDIFISDLLGREMIIIRNIPVLPYHIDISDLPSGIYIIRMNTEDGETGSAKFVKIAE